MKSLLSNLNYLCFFLLFFVSSLFPAVKKTIIEQNNSKIVIDIYVDATSDADLYPTSLLVGLPENKFPVTNIEYYKKSKIPFKSGHKPLNGFNGFNWTNIQKLKNLYTGTIRISPLSIDDHYFKKVRVTIDFKLSIENNRAPNNSEVSFLKDRLINWDIAKNWFLKSNRTNHKVADYHQGTWYQFSTEKDGLYSLSYETLSNTISDLSNIDPRSISIFTHKNSGRSKDHSFNQPIENNLVEIKIKVDGEEDGIFNLN